MATGKELKKISLARLKTARILMDAHDYDMAMYILGYCFECALKSAICKRLNFINYPDQSGDGEKINIFKTHKFDVLLALAGMERDFSLTSSSRRVENWSILTKWNPGMKYEIKNHTLDDVEKMLKALTEKPHGIIKWMTKQKKW